MTCPTPPPSTTSSAGHSQLRAPRAAWRRRPSSLDRWPATGSKSTRRSRGPATSLDQILTLSKQTVASRSLRTACSGVCEGLLAQMACQVLEQLKATGSCAIDSERFIRGPPAVNPKGTALGFGPSPATGEAMRRIQSGSRRSRPTGATSPTTHSSGDTPTKEQKWTLRIWSLAGTSC